MRPTIWILVGFAVTGFVTIVIGSLRLPRLGEFVVGLVLLPFYCLMLLGAALAVGVLNVWEWVRDRYLMQSLEKAYKNEPLAQKEDRR